MSLFVSGSDGNLYIDPYNLQYTGSVYKTNYVVDNGDGVNEDDDDGLRVPGILFDTSLNQYWADIRWACADYLGDDGVVDSYDTGSNSGTIWVYDLTDEQKNTIENDAEYIATYVTSSL